MLTTSSRLRKDADIKRLFQKGKSVFDEICSLKYAPNGMKYSRFAVVVGTKVSKKAVERNRIKRRVRAVLAKKVPCVPPGFDLAFMARKEAMTIPFPELEQRIARALKKAKLCEG